jgi:ribosomal protein S18 acetylase RimI-like enzyme
MTDMLVKLYDLTQTAADMPKGVAVRRALAAEKHILTDWVRSHFGPGWADECGVSFCRLPISCFMAVSDGQPVGFCIYDSTARGMLGPIGVAPSFRRRGIGCCLLLATLGDMRAQGYAYGVIGWVESPQFFSKTCGATPIEGSEPGLYQGLVK